MSQVAVSPYSEAFAEVDAALERLEKGERWYEEALRLRQDFGRFIIAAWPLVVPRSFIPTWHLQTIAEHVQAAYEREILRLIVTIPPGFAKSSVLSVFGPAWLWTWAPQTRLMTASFHYGLSGRDARRSRMLMLTDWYRQRWGSGWDFIRDEASVTRYGNTVGGTRVSTYTGGGTGDRGSILQIDDPHNAKEVHSEAMLQATLDWHADTWSSRLDDAVDMRGVKIVIGQRLAERDLIGHLLAGEDVDDPDPYYHLCLPVEYEAKHPFVYPERVKLPSGKEIQGDPRKVEGELLAPGYMSGPILRDRTRELTAQVYAAQYQQRPAPAEGNLLKRANWRYYPPDWSFYAPRGRMERSSLPPFRMIISSWDTSIKDRAKSDFVSGGIWGVPRLRQADRWLLRLWHRRAALNETIEAMLELAAWTQENWPDVAHYIVIETTANGPDAIAEIRGKVQGVQEWAAKGSKEMRAEAAQPFLEGHNLYLPGFSNEEGTNYDSRTPLEVQEFIEELAVFNLGTHDDHVDMWSQMCNWSRKHGMKAASMAGTKARKPRPSALPR